MKPRRLLGWPSAPFVGCILALLGVGGCSESRHEPPKRIPEVERLLDPNALADDGAVSKAIAQAAKLHDRQATPRLVEALEHDDPGVRVVAAAGLFALKDPASAGALRDYLRVHDPVVTEQRAITAAPKERDASVEAWTIRFAIETLGELRDEQAAPLLEKALATTTWRSEAAAALLKVRPLEPALERRDLSESEAQALGSALSGKAGPEKAPMLLRVLSGKAMHHQVRLGAARALGRLGMKDAAPVLLKVARDQSENPVLRIGCAASLGRMEGAKHLPLFEALLSPEEDSTVRRGVARELGELGLREALPLLVRSLEGEDDPTRFQAATAVARISGEHFQVEDKGDTIILRWAPPSKVFQTGKSVTFTGSYTAQVRQILSYRQRMGGT